MPLRGQDARLHSPLLQEIVSFLLNFFRLYNVLCAEKCNYVPCNYCVYGLS